MLSVTINISGRVVAGATVIGIAVAISSLGIVRAEREYVGPDVKVFNCTSGKACVEGNAAGKNVEGVFGNSTLGTGVQGNSTATNKNSGVAGVNSATTGTGYGVYGRSSNGPGLYGTSAVGNGIEGYSSASISGSKGCEFNGPPLCPAGVAGFYSPPPSQKQFQGGFGVAGRSESYYGVGVLAEDLDGGPAFVALGGGGGTNLDPVIAGYAADAYTWLFGVSNSSGNNCQIDNLANETCTGSITGYGGLSVRHRTSEGRHVLAYAAESTSRTIEDVGTARMAGGVANVQIEPAFASVTDRTWYYVFLTPLGDTRGLYVSMKTATAFQVREIEHGRSNVEFDYRIVAHPLGARGDRLPPAPTVPKPRFPKNGMLSTRQ
jgi:hypothetical protein